ncbi:MAG: pyridoxal phosphate-dependent aminotransferase [Betaproteobacteria bacterium]|nr:pyridoxal phosphate-dependent aminotransferase [Betaproteobacteria bacterium]MDE2123363.1 pyridoxal phosphate-dependent aminotransferase [Betaproteobacteria bacterium]MDE2187351.1 pyridoxal phosphate-dependent aminotransferase [Betaproteobacteria bacterium]MDE2323100.1 pyridoxal phosphate-dependent aminotransferase [Betaproteobacteria bacterium]
MQLASRLQQVEPFYVMDVVRAAWEQQAQWTAQGRSMIHLSVGEPDFTAPQPVVDAGIAALREGRSGYTLAPGLPALREAIARHYADKHGVAVSPERIFITAGASGALTLACLLLVEPGSEVLMPDPTYPCNKNFVVAAGGSARLLPTSAATRFQPTAAQIDAAWGPATRGVLLASPSNPTGTSIAPDELARIAAVVRRHGGFLLVDEIYLELGFDPAYGRTALALDAAIISINSFSKYFQMTGWRLGWMVVPQELVEPLTRLAGNLYICPSTPAQHAALACFTPATLAEAERRRAEFQRRRDVIVPALQAIGLDVPVQPDGAFYVWADCSRHAADSWDFCFDVMRETGVVLVPGKDFATATMRPERWFRLSYANSVENLREAAARLSVHLARGSRRSASA